MPVSYNGWSASPNPGSIGIGSYAVPGTSRRIAIRSSAAPILLWAMAWWHENVEPIDSGQLDDWGYAYRDVRGSSTALSCHASGTAVDINATRYPRGTNNMPATKVVKVRHMVHLINAAAGKTLIKWGGEWSGGSKDQMHLELGPGTSGADVMRAVRNLDTSTDWFDMADKADLREVVDNALASDALKNAVRLAIEAERDELVDAVTADLTAKLADTGTTLSTAVRKNVRTAVDAELTERKLGV